MKRYKKTVLLFAAVGLFSACEDFLDLRPTNSLVADNAISDVATARAVVNAAYTTLKSYSAGSSSYVLFGALPGDNVKFGGSLSQFRELDDHAFGVINAAIVSGYQNSYNIINRTNWVIADVPKINDASLTQEEKDRLVGEAYFIRGLTYFNLGRSWGGVQLQLNPTTSLSALGDIPRSTQAATYAHVKSDLKEAERLLSDDAATRNRAQKSAARALLARLHLYTEEWEEAERYADPVIANTAKYELVKPYRKFFQAPFLSKESVLELTSTRNNSTNSWSGWFPANIVSEVTGRTLSGGSYEYRPTDEIIEKLNDPNTGGDRMALLAQHPNGNWYNVLYHMIEEVGGQPANTDPAYVIRIAELYLIRAEARAKKTPVDLQGAIADLNAIRERANVPLFPTSGTSVAAVIQAIEDERRVEFAFEGQRWYDLVRTKRAGIVLGVDEEHWLFPLPNTDVIADPSLNGENNPGY